MLALPVDSLRLGQYQNQTNLIGQSDDVESDGEISFLIYLRISDKILGYILN